MTTLADVILGPGLVGDRPPAGKPGRLYFATDVNGGELQRDSGSGWDAVSAPAAAAFSMALGYCGMGGSEPVAAPAGQTVNFWPVHVYADTDGYFANSANGIVLPTDGWYVVTVILAAVETSGIDAFISLNFGSPFGDTVPRFGPTFVGDDSEGHNFTFSHLLHGTAASRVDVRVENDGEATLHVGGTVSIERRSID